MQKILLSLLILLLVTGCSSSDSKAKKAKAEISQQTVVQELFDQGMAALKDKRYKTAIKKFETIEREHPFSKLAIKSQVMIAYVQYRGEDYDDAILTIERFLKTHPGNINVAYAMYIRALCYYDRIVDVRRDQEFTAHARDALKELIARFPKSEYAQDARLKLDLVRDHLAGKEMEVGRFYLKRDHYIGAIGRFKKVVEDYDGTSHVPEALHRLVESYLSLGAVAEAKKYASVLGHNFPDSKWYKHSYELLNNL